MKKVIFTIEQVSQIKALLNGVTTTGIQNAKQIAVMAQILDAGEEEKEKEENNGSKDSTGNN